MDTDSDTNILNKMSGLMFIKNHTELTKWIKDNFNEKEAEKINKMTLDSNKLFIIDYLLYNRDMRLQDEFEAKVESGEIDEAEERVIVTYNDIPSDLKAIEPKFEIINGRKILK